MKTLLFILLAFENSTNVFDKILLTVRTYAISGTGTKAAMTLATFIVGLKLIKMAYHMFSDEQQGGFGGIRLWQVLRPILIILAINVSSTAFNVVDSTVNYITSSVASSFNESGITRLLNAVTNQTVKGLRLTDETISLFKDLNSQKAYDAGYKENVEKYTTGTGYADKNSVYAPNAAGLKAVEDQINNAVDHAAEDIIAMDAIYKDRMKELDNWLTNKFEGIQQQEEAGIGAGSAARNWITARKNENAIEPNTLSLDIIMAGPMTYKDAAEIYDIIAKDIRDEALARNSDVIENLRTQGKAISDANGTISAAAATNALFEGEIGEKRFWKSVTDKRWWENLIEWFYKLIAFCVNAFASISLVILSIFFPWLLVLSLLDYYKQGLWQFFSTYLSLSMYKVVAAAIIWLIDTAQGTIQLNTALKIIPNLGDTASQLEALDVSLSVRAMLYVAGVICLTKVGSIVKMIIPGGADSGDMAGAGGAMAMGAGRMMASGAKKVAGGAAGLATGSTGIQKAASAKKAAAGTSQFQQNVSNALGRLSGGGGYGNDDGR